MKIRVSDYIANFLEEKKVKKVFLLSGGGMMHLLDAISRKKEIGYICNHHEQASAMASEGYARKSGNLGVCYATTGPGATNILTGLVGAWQDSSPVLFITGQSKLSQTIQHSQLAGLRQFGTFEVDIVPIVQSVTKYAVFLNDPNKIRYELEKAYFFAKNGRPGPVLIDIPVDIQGALIDPMTLEGFTANLITPSPIPDEVFINAIKRLTAATRPLILAGHGVRAANATELFEKIIKQLNIPVATTLLAKDLLEYDNPLFVGHPGMKGDRAGNFAVQNADVILLLGCSLHVLTTGYELDKFAPNAYKIQVELDEKILLREQVGVNEKINCDLTLFLSAVERLGLKQHSQKTNVWHDRCQQWKSDYAVINEPHKKSATEINYYEFMDLLSQSCKGNETITTDAGSAYYVVGQAFLVKKGQRVIVSGALGSMGFAVPAATGASIADPDGTVICITGDGSLQTNIHELATIRHYNLNIKLFILNNHGYVSIRNTQNNFFNGHFAGVDHNSGVSSPNLEKIAAAYGLPYYSARTVSELPNMLNHVLNEKGPVFCEIFTSKEQEIIPTVTSEKLSDGRMVSKSLDEMYPFLRNDIISA